jgi:hypothetical protein
MARKIVRGKRYDTEKSTEIGSASGGGAVGDFSYWEATLYRAPRSGAYFLAGEGGPMTRFAQSIGQNQWSGGEDIIPMTRQEAFDWAQEHLDLGIVEDEFPDLIEDA